MLPLVSGLEMKNIKNFSSVKKEKINKIKNQPTAHSSISEEHKWLYAKWNLERKKSVKSTFFLYRPATNNWKITPISNSLGFTGSPFITVSEHLHKNQWNEARENGRNDNKWFRSHTAHKNSLRWEINQFLKVSFNVFTNWITVVLRVFKKKQQQ